MIRQLKTRNPAYCIRKRLRTEKYLEISLNQLAYTCDLFYEINKSYTCLLNTIRAINISLFATNKSSDKLFSDESRVRLLYIIQYHIPTSPSQLTAKWKNILCQLQSLKILFWKDNTYLTGTEMMVYLKTFFCKVISIGTLQTNCKFFFKLSSGSS